MTRWASAVDANQSEIVSMLRTVGCTVQLLHKVGQGCPDLLVGYRGQNLLLEVKDGELSPSARKLTDRQVEWHRDWRGQVAVVCNVREAMAALGITGTEWVS
jgi:hypothetical protein